jgi:hypothetical protein
MTDDDDDDDDVNVDDVNDDVNDDDDDDFDGMNGGGGGGGGGGGNKRDEDALYELRGAAVEVIVRVCAFNVAPKRTWLSLLARLVPLLEASAAAGTFNHAFRCLLILLFVFTSEICVFSRGVDGGGYVQSRMSLVFNH